MKTVVFYDNLCSVCNYWVRWILENDSEIIFYFAALESDFTKEFSCHFNYEFPKETIVVWDERAGFLKKTDAVIFILQALKPASFQLKALRLFPKLFRDMGYSVFAYFREYVQKEGCELPSPEHMKRFLTDNSFQDFLK
ncbi:MAG: DUF393 domain-containing protein [Bacteroidales bacterium]|nr:DUF393 domain-containing protein [Bacteroidales bacterium]